jgi:hypothetical protein
VVEGVNYHHNPFEAPKFPKFVSIVDVADILVYEMGLIFCFGAINIPFFKPGF